MRRSVYGFLLVTVILFSLSACARSQLSVTDVSISQTGDISASITPNKDMEEVVACVTAKDSTGKINFEGELQLSESFQKNEKTIFSFNVFDTSLWAGAKISYNPFGNMFMSFLEDSVSCQLTADEETIASFTIDTSKIDLQKAMERLSSQDEAQESVSSPVTHEESSSSQNENPLPTVSEEEKGKENDTAFSASDEKDALALISKAGIGDIVTDSDNLMGIHLEEVRFDDDGDVYIQWAFTNDIMRSNKPYAFTQIRFFDPDDLSVHYAAFKLNDDNTFSMNFKAGDEIGSYDFVHLNHEEFNPESGVIFMYFNGSGEDAPEEIYTVPLVFTIYTGSDGPHAVEDTPRYAPEEMIKAFNEN